MCPTACVSYQVFARVHVCKRACKRACIRSFTDAASPFIGQTLDVLEGFDDGSFQAGYFEKRRAVGKGGESEDWVKLTVKSESSGRRSHDEHWRLVKGVRGMRVRGMPQPESGDGYIKVKGLAAKADEMWVKCMSRKGEVLYEQKFKGGASGLRKSECYKAAEAAFAAKEDEEEEGEERDRAEDNDDDDDDGGGSISKSASKGKRKSYNAGEETEEEEISATPASSPSRCSCASSPCFVKGWCASAPCARRPRRRWTGCAKSSRLRRRR